jgi:hypothetical protein
LEYEDKPIIGGQLPLEGSNMKVAIGFKGYKRHIDVVDGT